MIAWPFESDGVEFQTSLVTIRAIKSSKARI